MALVTVEEIKRQALNRSDNRYSSFIQDDELTDYVNSSAQELYDLMVASFEDYYFQELFTTLAPQQDTITLPTNFYKLRGIDEVINAQFRVTVKPYMWLERNTYIYPVGGRNLALYWIPKMPVLVNDNDTFDGMNGFEQYIVTDVARKILMKEESDVQAFLLEKEEIKNRIKGMAANRNAGDSDRIQDVYRQDAYIMYAYPQRLRYRLQGEQIQFVETNFYGNVYG
jgi:hypothetical protein